MDLRQLSTMQCSLWGDFEDAKYSCCSSPRVRNAESVISTQPRCAPMPKRQCSSPSQCTSPHVSRPEPIDALLGGIVYPQPDFRWYDTAQRHPSIWSDSDVRGLKQPMDLRPQTSDVALEETKSKVEGVITIRIDNSLHLNDDAHLKQKMEAALAEKGLTGMSLEMQHYTMRDGRGNLMEKAAEVVHFPVLMEFAYTLRLDLKHLTVVCNTLQEAERLDAKIFEAANRAGIDDSWDPATVTLTDNTGKEYGEECFAAHFDWAKVSFPMGIKVVMQKQAAVDTLGQSKQQDSSSLGLFVHILEVQGLRPADRVPTGQGHYYVSVHYPSEMSDVIQQRRTKKPVAAVRDSAGTESCTFGEQYCLPYNDMEQFIKIAVFRAGLAGDEEVGEATIPTADRNAESVSSWPLVHDFEQCGEVRLVARRQEQTNSARRADTVAIDTGHAPKEKLCLAQSSYPNSSPLPSCRLSDEGSSRSASTSSGHSSTDESSPSFPSHTSQGASHVAHNSQQESTANVVDAASTQARFPGLFPQIGLTMPDIWAYGPFSSLNKTYGLPAVMGAPPSLSLAHGSVNSYSQALGQPTLAGSTPDMNLWSQAFGSSALAAARPELMLHRTSSSFSSQVYGLPASAGPAFDFSMRRHVAPSLFSVPAYQ